jgi:hypothetical protein
MGKTGRMQYQPRLHEQKLQKELQCVLGVSIFIYWTITNNGMPSFYDEQNDEDLSHFA